MARRAVTRAVAVASPAMQVLPDIVPVPAPEPAPAPIDVDAALVRLRAERAALLARLHALELAGGGSGAGSDDPSLFIDRVEAKLALAALLDEWRALLALALTAQHWPALGSVPPRFADRQAGKGWISARALVPLTPDSLLFVHGPVTLWHAAALAEELVGPQDRIVCLAKGGFHRELTYEPRITVWDAAQPDGLARPADGEPAAEGVFVTASGRRLHFVAVPDEAHVPSARAGWHPLTAAMIARPRHKAATPVTITEELDPALWPGANAATRASDVLLAKGEAILAAATQNIAVGDRIMLIARVSDFRIEPCFAAFLASRPVFEFAFDWARQKPIPGRGGFVPMRYRILPGEPEWQRSLFICLDSHIGL